MRSIIYCRKSTDDSTKQQQSLGTQLEWCENYATNNNINVVYIIVVSKSVKATGREGFEKLMSQIENGVVNTIICMYFDRLSRNPRVMCLDTRIASKMKGFEDYYINENIYYGR